ncbi:MAG: hypothetical protein IJU46_06975 [Clostridia bacterium]|nr:hypothetical protein [Lachnospiraceae bacterium]MBQ7592245.1 hypothetical protein [Clostridia bacterium]
MERSTLREAFHDGNQNSFDQETQAIITGERKYEQLRLEIVVFDEDDVITSSNDLPWSEKEEERI